MCIHIILHDYQLQDFLANGSGMTTYLSNLPSGIFTRDEIRYETNTGHDAYEGVEHRVRAGNVGHHSGTVMVNSDLR